MELVVGVALLLLLFVLFNNAVLGAGAWRDQRVTVTFEPDRPRGLGCLGSVALFVVLLLVLTLVGLT